MAPGINDTLREKDAVVVDALRGVSVPDEE